MNDADMADGRPGRRGLGPRDITTVRLPASVQAAAERAAAARGIDRGAFLADAICYRSGCPDLMRHPELDTLFAPDADGGDVSDVGDHLCRNVTVRLPSAVARLAEATARTLRTDRSTYLSDLIVVHMGRPDLARILDQELMEVLPLAI